MEMEKVKIVVWGGRLILHGLFTTDKINRKDLSECEYAYDILASQKNNPVAITNYVYNRRFGTVILDKPINSPEISKGIHIDEIYFSGNMPDFTYLDEKKAREMEDEKSYRTIDGEKTADCYEEKQFFEFQNSLLNEIIPNMPFGEVYFRN